MADRAAAGAAGPGMRKVSLSREDTSVSFGFALASQKNGDKVVVTLYPEGLAAGSLQRGDKILEINGTSMDDVDHDTMVTLIKGATNLDMTVLTMPAMVAVDWGTTHFRAFLVSARGQVLQRVTTDGGLVKLRKSAATQEEVSGVFEEHLKDAVGSWMESHPGLPVMMCGMVGAKEGWVEAPYASCPSSADSIVQYVVPVPNSLEWNVSVIPGVTCSLGPSSGDVMRGEETQLLGMMARNKLTDGVVCIPGTHSKWAVVKDGAIESFKTFMTGETYSLYSKASILRYALDGEGFGDTSKEADRAGFLDGVRTGYAKPAEVTHSAFMVRTRALLHPAEASPSVLRAYLSGLLIGVEIAGAGVEPKSTVHIIASEGMAARYGDALSTIEVKTLRTPADSSSIIGLLRVLASMPKDESEEEPVAEDADDSCRLM